MKTYLDRNTGKQIDHNSAPSIIFELMAEGIAEFDITELSQKYLKMLTYKVAEICVEIDNWIVDDIDFYETLAGAEPGDLCVYDEKGWVNNRVIAIGNFVGYAVDEITGGKYYYFRRINECLIN